MVIRLITILLVIIGLYTVMGWGCHSDTFEGVRDALGLERGCKIQESIFDR